ncbi:5-formyltetrahydrofolate cyclo-ligase [Schaalia sp. 19OD2882]|nr:5-formyltetrahydrofolate cyclo-ligase [Schaalia sp. 19OD2882]
MPPASAVSADPPSPFVPAPTASSAPRSGLTAALFWPTLVEPDVRGIVARAGRCLLPVLTDEGGAALADPMWGWCDLSDAGLVGPRASSQLHSPDPHLPLQPSAARLPPSVLACADVVLAPALAVDASGTRLGQGGGWYDRALLHVREGVPVVAAVFDEEVLPAGTIPRETHDRSVNAVITPTRVLLLD